MRLSNNTHTYTHKKSRKDSSHDLQQVLSMDLGCSCLAIAMEKKHSERIIILIYEKRYLLYYNDCHFACRFISLQAKKSSKRKKKKNQIFFFHLSLYTTLLCGWLDSNLKRRRKKSPAQHEKVDFCFREVFFFLPFSVVFAFCIWIARDCWFFEKKSSEDKRKNVKSEKNLFLLSGRHSKSLLFHPQVMFVPAH